MAEPASNIATIGLTQIGHDRAVPARLILKAAKKIPLHECLIIGRDDKGELWMKSSVNASQSLWLLERLKERLLSGNAWSVV